MAKFYGKVGFASTVESAPGVYTNDIVEKYYRGDVLKNTRRYEQGSGVADDVKLNNKISILGDNFSNEHFHELVYVEWLGGLWRVTNVEITHPRLILTLGGVYNE